jgi:hypothetical protein
VDSSGPKGFIGTRFCRSPRRHLIDVSAISEAHRLSRTPIPMSLNICEQRVFDYLQANRDELQFWREKVRVAAARTPDQHALAGRLDIELWQYYEERSAVVPRFRETAGRESLRRMSMRNLAELLLRLWTDPKPKKASSPPIGPTAI